jgi:hypothetical protein
LRIDRLGGPGCFAHRQVRRITWSRRWSAIGALHPDRTVDEGGRLSYRIDNVGKIPDDIQRWADDGAVVCSIVNAPQNHEVIYMWAELRSEGVPHIGEVGLHYEANSLGTSEGKRVFSRLIRDTAARHLSGNDTDQLSNALAEKIFNSMKTSPRLQEYS